MKAGLLAVAGLAAVVVAQPHRRHEALHERAAAMETAWFTEIDVVTATAPAAYVYVDQNGNPIAAPAATSEAAAVVQHGNWNGQEQGDHGHEHPAPAHTTTTVAPVAAPAPTTTTAAAAVVPVISIPAVPIVPVSIAPVVIPVPSLPAAPVASSVAGSSGSNAGRGVSYSPYTYDKGPCRSADQVASEIKALGDYSYIRLYGTDCNQISNVMAAMSPSQKVFLGIFFIDRGSMDGPTGEIQTLIKEVNGRWSSVEAIAVGNEQIFGKKASASDVLDAVSYARSQLASSYSGLITTVDIVEAYQNNQNLCAAGDSGSTKAPVYVNIHPYFDGKASADTAGIFLLSQISLVKVACPGRDVIVAETGWPNAGTTNGNAIAGHKEQITALGKLRDTFSSGIYFLSAHDEEWKAPGKWDVEQHWGMVSS